MSPMWLKPRAVNAAGRAGFSERDFLQRHCPCATSCSFRRRSTRSGSAPRPARTPPRRPAPMSCVTGRARPARLWSSWVSSSSTTARGLLRRTRATRQDREDCAPGHERPHCRHTTRVGVRCRVNGGLCRAGLRSLGAAADHGHDHLLRPGRFHRVVDADRRGRQRRAAPRPVQRPARGRSNSSAAVR